MNGDDCEFIFHSGFKQPFVEKCAIKTFDEVEPNFIAARELLAAYYPVNSADIRLQAPQTKGQESTQPFFLQRTAENSDHALLCIINI